ncbi:MAG: hypothetical protein JSU70_00570 [Phycisphaerales bacterium]|nr:MAG: hypothetical protein JSU70_00570 [Phycisphaerales bacterium]
MSECPQITFKRHTFLSSLAMGFTALGMTLMISCTVVVIYGMHFVGDQSDKLVSSIGSAIRGLPELRASLPPIVADVLDDRRQPDYRSQVEITAKMSPFEDHGGRLRTVVEVVNNGDDVVSLLSLRITVLDAHGEVLSESNEWAATPIAADHDWRGPLMPGSRRHFASSARRMFRGYSQSDLRTEVEVTDIRVWKGKDDTLATDKERLGAAGKSGDLQLASHR